MTERLIVAVLAGGEGRRMAGLKALRPFRGAPLVAHAVALARRWSDEVVVSVRDAAQVGDAVDAPLVLDTPDAPGPLAGLAAALAYARGVGAARLLTAPCDMPSLPVDLAARLGSALTAETVVAVASASGRLQPACSLWRVEALDQLPRYLAAGKSSLWGFAELCGMAVVEWEPEAAGGFVNANTPEELERLAHEAPALKDGAPPRR